MGGVGVASAGCSFYHSLLPHHHRHMISSSSTTCCTPLTLYHIVRRPPYLLLSNTTPPSPRRPRNRLLLFTRAFADTSPAAADDDDDEEALVTPQLQQLPDSLNSQKPPDIPPDSVTSSYAHMSTASFDLSRPLFLPQYQSSCVQPFNNPDGAGDVTGASVELKANSVGHLPLSLQMIIKRKKKHQQQLLLLGNPTACCSSSSSVKRAFSSMVFIIRELQSYTLPLLRENLREGILNRVQGEMHASFVWLFQHIFACNPTLMLSLMLLLANFTAHSMMAHAATPTPQYPSVVTTVSAAAIATDDNHHTIEKTSAVESASIGGGGGGGRKSCRPVAGSTDDGRPIMFLPKGMSTAPATADDDALIVVAREEEKEARLWNEIVEEARSMQAACRDEALMEPEILQRMVSPVSVEIEEEKGEKSAYVKTELMYHQALSQEPHSALLLTNFAQFLYLVLHDHDRAEVYFRRAVRTMPVDAEALSRYASFLWGARRDLGAAEEAYLEAIAADPGNAYHAASYANFLWSTGGGEEDTCYPIG